MHLQVALRQPGLKLSFNSFSFVLGSAVYQPIICIPTPWEVEMCPRHPQIERVVHEEIGQDWANHAPYTKGNFDRLGLGKPHFVAERKESECCDEW